MNHGLSELLDDDHVVPDQSVPEESQTVALYCSSGESPPKSTSSSSATAAGGQRQTTRRTTRRQESELWADIEDLLALENSGRSSAAAVSDRSEEEVQEAGSVQVSARVGCITRDFSELIASLSPQRPAADTQQVPLLSWHDKLGSTSCPKPYQRQAELGSSWPDLGSTRPELGSSRTELGTSPIDLGNSPTDLGTSLTDFGTSPPSREPDAREPARNQPSENLLTLLNPVSVGTGSDRTTANEKICAMMDNVIQHGRNPLCAEYNHYDLYNNGFDVTDDVDSFLQGGPCGVVLEERIRYACTVLDIPMDPNTWTVDQVQKWAMFVLKRDDGLLLDTEPIMGLTLDGATLTRMTKDDLISYFPKIGETLYNELEVWCFGITSSLSSGALSQLPSEPEYVDLDNFAKNKSYDVITPTFPSSPLQSPTSSLTSSIPSISSPDDVLLPPLCSLMPGHTTYIKPEIGDRDDVNVTRTELSSVATSIGGYSNYSSYSPSSSSCGNSSTDDLFDDQETANQPRSDVISDHRHGGKHTIQLWQFLKNLLLQPQYESYIRWLDRGKGIFKIEDSAYVAKLWGRRKNRPAMNYDKLSRSIRQYYKKGIIKKTGQSKRLVYQFCPQYNS